MVYMHIVREPVKFAKVGTSSGLLLGVEGWRQASKVQPYNSAMLTTSTSA